MILKKGSQVKVITGKDKGKTGEILEIDRKKNRVKIKSINIIKKQSRYKISRGKKIKIQGYKKAIVTLKKGQNIDLSTGI